MPAGPEKNYRFDDFELDLARRRLLRSGEVVALKPKVFDLLALLVENNGRLLTKDDLFREVWGDQFVEETNLTVSISAIRRALGETASAPRYITNVSGRGYYFTADVADPEQLNGGLVIESRSVQRIVTESEETTESGPERLPAGQPSLRRTYVLLAVVALLAVTALGGYFMFVRSRENAGRFQALSVNRLTATGRTITAALSPDGRMYAFSQVEPDGNHSLWLSQTDGSGQVQLRGPKPFAIGGTAFAPDGNRVYYVQVETETIERGTLYRIPTIGGVAEKLRDDVWVRAALSPRGDRLAFVRYYREADRAELVISDIDGGGERVLLARENSEGGLTAAISFSPDGRRIAIAARTSERSPGPTDIFTVGVDDGDISRVTREDWNSVPSVCWTRDPNTLIAAVGEAVSDQEKQVVQVSMTDGSVRRLLADSNSYLSLSAAADGSALAAIQGTALSNVWVAPADDLASARQVTFDMLGKQSGWNSIDWTNDGHIVYSGRVGRSDAIWEMNAAGEGQRQVLPETARSQYVSLPNDGSFFVFTSNRSGASEVWRAARDGTDLKQLTNGGDNQNPHVSPDGRLVIYSSGRGAAERLWAVPAEGGESTQLTQQPADWARFSPDGQFIACSYPVDGKTRLAVLSASGGPPLRLFSVPPTANFRLSVRWTPDGKAVTYRDWQNGIWRQDIKGGDPVRLAGLPAEKLFAYAWSRDGNWFAFGRGIGISDAVLLTDLK